MPPHAPCRLQRGKEKCNEISASLPPHAPCRLQRFINSTDEIEVHLCLHTLRADCNGKEYRKPASHNLCLHTLRADCNDYMMHPRRSAKGFASTRSVQIATFRAFPKYHSAALCLHTLRADCNGMQCRLHLLDGRFASTRSVQIATRYSAPNGLCVRPLPPHAPCRLQLRPLLANFHHAVLCLHTLRADCNRRSRRRRSRRCTLPPHAPCRLQRR